MMNKRLILLTAGFPYGNGETFLENEIEYLADVFQEVEILCPTPKDLHVRYLPANCKVSFYQIEITKFDKIKALFGIFDKITRDEIKIIQEVYLLKFSKGILFTFLISLYQAKRIAKICRKRFLTDADKKSNTVFYSYWCDDTALALALLKERDSNIKCISRMHRWDIYFEESKVNYLPFRKFIAEKLDKIFSISEDGITYATRKWKVNANSFALTRLGVEKSIRVKPTGNVLKIVSCSNVIPVKRVHLIAEALIDMKSINIQWFHFGDGSLFNELKEITNKFPKNIEVSLPGRVLNHEIYQAYQDIQPHVFINVSSSEGVPVSLMEAMSFGIPCIATDVGGNREIVTNENGLLLDSNPTLNSIQTAFKDVLNNEEKRNAAYTTWEKHYNAKKNYTEFVERLKEIVSSNEDS